MVSTYNVTNLKTNWMHRTPQRGIPRYPCEAQLGTTNQILSHVDEESVFDDFKYNYDVQNASTSHWLHMLNIVDIVKCGAR